MLVDFKVYFHISLLKLSICSNNCVAHLCLGKFMIIHLNVHLSLVTPGFFFYCDACTSHQLFWHFLNIKSLTGWLNGWLFTVLSALYIFYIHMYAHCSLTQNTHIHHHHHQNGKQSLRAKHFHLLNRVIYRRKICDAFCNNRKRKPPQPPPPYGCTHIQTMKM